MEILNNYFVIAFDKKFKTKQGFLRKDMVLYCYHHVDDEYWFKDTYSGHLVLILPETEVSLYLVKTQVNIKPLFKRHAKDIADSIGNMYKYLPISARYVIDDINKGDIEKAYCVLITEADKIRGSLLDEELKLHCVSI